MNGFTKFILLHVVGKRRFLDFRQCFIQAYLSLVSNFKGHSLTCERKIMQIINTISLISIDRSKLSTARTKIPGLHD